MSTYIYISFYVLQNKLNNMEFYGTTVGEKNIWSPADLYVCPLTKKLSVYIILMVGYLNSERQNNKKKSRKTHLKKIK